MYGIFTYLYQKFMINVGKYSIHGAYGMEYLALPETRPSEKEMSSSSWFDFREPAASFL